MRTLPVADPLPPPVRSVRAFIAWLARRQWRTLLGGAAAGTVWMLCQAVWPALLGRAVDAVGSAHRAEVLRTAAVLAAVAALQVTSGVIRHRHAVSNRLQASLRAARLVGRKVAFDGPAVATTMATGEIASAVATDAPRLGNLYDVTARLSGAIASWLLVSLILFRSSARLGWIVLVGVPLLSLAMTVLIAPLQRRQADQRAQAGRLATLGADTVAGLRVLRGVGGEDVFVERYRSVSRAVQRSGVAVAGPQSVLDALQVLVPGVFLVGLVWYGAQLALEGRISAGQLVAFYGYAAFLTLPLRTASEAVQVLSRARVGSQRVLSVLRVTPSVQDRLRPLPEPEAGAPLVHRTCGLVLKRQGLVGLVGADPDEGAMIAEDLGRLEGSGSDQMLWDGAPLNAYAIGAVRRRIVVSRAVPHLFTGTLREGLDPHNRLDDTAILGALRLADAEDIVLGLPDGLDEQLEEGGLSLSGGQRQRLALARALLTDAEVLVLVEPTSAVDAHTEDRIARRLATVRAGRTTLVVTASPMLLAVADEVAFLRGGRIVARGTHTELSGRADGVGAAYRRVVLRADDEEVEIGASSRC